VVAEARRIDAEELFLAAEAFRAATLGLRAAEKGSQRRRKLAT